MKRTMLRPLPWGRTSRSHAVNWAVTAAAAGTTLLACKANMLAAGLAAANLGLYALVYTPLKRIQPVNTWVGAVVGGYNRHFSDGQRPQVMFHSTPLILPAALYFWQIPHFMALPYLRLNDSFNNIL